MDLVSACLPAANVGRDGADIQFGVAAVGGGERGGGGANNLNPRHEQRQKRQALSAREVQAEVAAAGSATTAFAKSGRDAADTGAGAAGIAGGRESEYRVAGMADRVGMRPGSTQPALARSRPDGAGAAGLPPPEGQCRRVVANDRPGGGYGAAATVAGGPRGRDGAGAAAVGEGARGGRRCKGSKTTIQAGGGGSLSRVARASLDEVVEANAPMAQHGAAARAMDAAEGTRHGGARGAS